MKFKKLLLIIWWLLLITSNFSESINTTSANSFYYDNGGSSPEIPSSMNTEFWKTVREEAIYWEVNSNTTSLKKIMHAFHLSTEIEWADDQPRVALYYIRRIINYVLYFASFITLLLLIFNFYKVVVWDDKEIENAKKNIKWILIALLFMAVAWFIISMIYWFYQIRGTDNMKLTQ
jgi:hypothetical protein